MILGCPTVGRKDLVHQLLDSLIGTVQDHEDFEFVIIDNSKEQEFFVEDYDACPFGVSVMRNNQNESYYYPLLQLWTIFDDPYIGLIHNDVIIYNAGWDRNMKHYFKTWERLGLIGFCGSREIDPAGGFGSGYICNFRGELGQTQPPGERITGIESAAILDSLFMMFRRDVIPGLGIDDNITPGHFNDRIWSLRTRDLFWEVCVMGVEIDHMGGQTSISEPEYFELCKRWCEEHNLDMERHISYDGEEEIGYNPGLAIYLEGQRRLLKEFRDEKQIIPFRVDINYTDILNDR